MELLFAWLLMALFVAAVFGSARRIGFFGSLALSLILSPLIGFIVTMFSETNEKAAYNKKILEAAQQSRPQPQNSISDEMLKLANLHSSGAITKEEYEAAKAKILK